MFAANDIQAGSALHLNYAVSYQVKDGLRLGVAGYYLEQLTDDRIDGVSVSGSKERVFAIGPGLMYQNNGWAFTANSYMETAAKNRPEGYRVVIHLARFF